MKISQKNLNRIIKEELKEFSLRSKGRPKNLVEAVIDDGQFDTPPPDVPEIKGHDFEGERKYEEKIKHLEQALTHLKQCRALDLGSMWDPDMDDFGADDEELDEIITSVDAYLSSVKDLKDSMY